MISYGALQRILKKQPILARFDIECQWYLAVGLQVYKTGENPLHYDLVGMPVGSTMQVNRAAQRNIIQSMMIGQGKLVKNPNLLEQ